MRIALRDDDGRRRGVIDVDERARPTRVAAPDGAEREIYLEWESAIDDAGHLRRCVACGCSDLFCEKAFPQITGFVVILAFAGATVGLLGLATTPMLVAMLAVLVIDVAILLVSQRRLVCYRCRTSYHDLPIARYHRHWDRSLADRYPRPRRTTDTSEDDAAPAA